MTTHAKRSPSGASGWLNCAGWTSDSKGSKFADEGTDAHELAALCLATGENAVAHLGCTMSKGNVVGSDMVFHVQKYIDYVRDVVAATGGELLVEQRLPITSITGEPDAHGTSDVVILAGDELIIVDLKYGMGVAVSAEHNEQLQIYALAALDEFSLVGDFKRVRMVIHQPRLNAVSEWVQTVEQLADFGLYIANRIAANDAEPSMRNPGDKQCRWCSSKATCNALAEKVQNVVGADFDDMADLGQLDHSLSQPATLSEKMAAVDLIEQWIKAVRAEVEARLLAGAEVPGYKLVQGKRGNRAWSDEEAAEELLKSKRVKLDEMYQFKLLTPAQIEKRLDTWVDADGNTREPILGPRQRKEILALVTQSDGKPSVALASDRRPALVMTAAADDFTDESACDLA